MVELAGGVAFSLCMYVGREREAAARVEWSGVEWSE